jgi:hypothetical protein
MSPTSASYSNDGKVVVQSIPPLRKMELSIIKKLFQDKSLLTDILGL